MSQNEDEFDELFKKIWKKFNEILSRVRKVELDKPNWDIKSNCIEPLINFSQEGNDIIITADLPKIEKENINVNADNRSITITADFKEKLKFENWGTVQKKVDFCRFNKTINLPFEIKPEEAKAEFKKGMLIIKVPKKKEVFNLKIE